MRLHYNIWWIFIRHLHEARNTDPSTGIGWTWRWCIGCPNGRWMQYKSMWRALTIVLFKWKVVTLMLLQTNSFSRSQHTDSFFASPCLCFETQAGAEYPSNTGTKYETFSTTNKKTNKLLLFILHSLAQSTILRNMIKQGNKKKKRTHLLPFCFTLWIAMQMGIHNERMKMHV